MNSDIYINSRKSIEEYKYACKMVGCLWTVYLPIHLKTWEQVGNSLRQKGGWGVFLYSVREFKGTGVSNQLEKKEE